MRLINSYEFKQKLLDDRDLLVPKTVNNMFAQAVRYGFHRALRCMEQCTTIWSETAKHGRWELHDDGSGTCDKCHFTQKHIWDDDGRQNYCGVCGADMRERRDNNAAD